MLTAANPRIALALLSSAFAVRPDAAKRLIKLDDMHAFHDVRDAQISPDGKWVAYTRHHASTPPPTRATPMSGWPVGTARSSFA